MAARDDVYVAIDSAIAEVKGREYTIIKGKRYAANHPVVKHAPALFELGSAFDHEVEQATAAPGEKRS